MRSLPQGLAELTVGGFDYQRAPWDDSFSAAGGDLTGAVEYDNDGPWRRVGVEDVHFHPMERPSVRLSLAWKS